MKIDFICHAKNFAVAKRDFSTSFRSKGNDEIDKLKSNTALGIKIDNLEISPALKAKIKKVCCEVTQELEKTGETEEEYKWRLLFEIAPLFCDFLEPYEPCERGRYVSEFVTSRLGDRGYMESRDTDKKNKLIDTLKKLQVLDFIDFEKLYIKEKRKTLSKGEQNRLLEEVNSGIMGSLISCGLQGEPELDKNYYNKDNVEISFGAYSDGDSLITDVDVNKCGILPFQKTIIRIKDGDIINLRYPKSRNV